MKWLQLDADFFNRPAIRHIVFRHGSAGIHVILNAWNKIASRIEKTDVACRLTDGLELVGVDCNVPTDKVAAIFDQAYREVYECINNIPYYVMDLDPVTKLPGCNLLIYKLDNNTSASPYIKGIKASRSHFEATSKGLRSDYEVTSKELRLPTHPITDLQTDLPCVENVIARPVGQILSESLYLREHVNNLHTAFVEGCPSCLEERTRGLRSVG